MRGRFTGICSVMDNSSSLLICKLLSLQSFSGKTYEYLSSNFSLGLSKFK